MSRRGPEGGERVASTPKGMALAEKVAQAMAATNWGGGGEGSTHRTVPGDSGDASLRLRGAAFFQWAADVNSTQTAELCLYGYRLERLQADSNLPRTQLPPPASKLLRRLALGPPLRPQLAQAHIELGAVVSTQLHVAGPAADDGAHAAAVRPLDETHPLPDG
eukprot:CAMPEP_0119386160 /NCGR_PEP_ID=MMETSP1334-20130426/94698_1 /TAXON_ID=127549 /ORGANISM="Calcidiscus leptoporus, Strain RCC1130" /LENGTH=162 /DNA_ID=CAMNT_0007407599 /DNA_START=167 /DNA_END=653 /DNA_ORIENTATION=-